MRRYSYSKAAAISAALFLAACETTATTPGLADTPAGEAPDMITVASGDNVIAGEIHRLAGTTPKTAVIIVGGSGARTRADTAPAAPLFMTEETAVTVYDRRGNGESTGSYERPTTANTAPQVPLFASDVADIVAHLKREGFTRVGLLGSSMGGWVNVAAGARSDEIDYIICISGGGSSVGVSDEFDFLTDEGMSIEDAAEAARNYQGEQGYDPAGDLARIAQPMLWVFGAADDSNPTALDVENVEAWRARGKPFDILILENTDHDLIDLSTGQMNMDWVEPVSRFIAGK